MILLYILGWLWSLPTILVGSIWLLFCRPQHAWWYKGCLEIEVKWLPMQALGETWGWIILYRVPEGWTLDDTITRVRDHERVHVKQNAILGPLFGPVYGFCSLWAWITGRHYYRDNKMESWARNESGEA